MDEACLRIAVALRIGAAICESHRCRCGAWIDRLGHHPLSCARSAGRHPRHAALNDVIKRALASANIASNLEPVGLDRGDGKRPDGMTIFPFKNGKSLVWDATCANTFAASHVNNCAIQSGYAADQAETAKVNKYRALMDRYMFQPISVETTGVLGYSTKSFIADLGRRITRETGDPREASWLRQRLCIAIARGNAQCILAAAKGEMLT